MRRVMSVVGFLAGLTGCVHAVPSERSRVSEVTFDEMVITGDVELEGMNDEELFATGTSAYAGQDYRQAARYFNRLCDFHPNSKYLRQAQFNAGLSLEKLKRWEDALGRFVGLADAASGQGDALDAAFRQAEVLYHLDRYDEATELLRTLANRTDLASDKRLEARVQEGVCEVEAGHLDRAEQTLRDAVTYYQALPDRELVDEYFPAQAQFFLGELYRLHYEGVALDGNHPIEQLAKDLEYKSELLLSAQGHYLRAIRMGNGYWATAAGQRIGGLYENMYDHMLHAPAPTSLTAIEQDAYREELRKRIRVLITKAISVYEHTLQAAERIGASSPFVQKTQDSLRRMKDLLLEAARAEDGAPGAPRGPGS
jgi:TolA-binding protein